MARRKPEEWIWQVGTELQRLGDEMIRMGPTLARKLWEPRIDVLESAHGFHIRCEIAGVRGDDISVAFNAEQQVMTIRGRRREEDPDSGDQVACHQLEIFYGEFEREVPLPLEHLELAETRAQYRNGVLTICVPKKVGVVRGRTVAVRGA